MAYHGRMEEAEDFPAAKRYRRDDPNVDPTNPDPSVVIHVRNLSPRATEADLLEALSHFGPIAYATCMPNKKMALVEFEDIDGARACVQFAQTKPINVAGQPALFNYSTSSMIQRLGLESEKPNHVLILTIYNAQYPITVDVIYEICNPHGDVKRIAIIRRSMLQALVEFENADIAKKAKHAMNGADIYSGCCTLKVEFAKPEYVKVIRNDQDQRDFTQPDLPSHGGEAPRRPLLKGGSGEQGYGHGGYGGGGYRGGYNTHRGGYDGGFGNRGGYQGGGGGGGYDEYETGGYGGHGDFGARTHTGAVLMVYGINHETMSCDKLFNILCQYGNIERVKFMRKKTDTAMVEMGGPEQVQAALSYLQDAELFGLRFCLRPSKQTEVREQGVPFDMPDGTPSFRDYSQSRNQRYTTPEHALRNRVCAPTPTLHWFNAPPNIDEERVLQIFRECGAPLPHKVTLHPSRTERSRTGTAEFASVIEANEALALANHTPVQTPLSKVPFIVKMAYFAPPRPPRYGQKQPSQSAQEPSDEQEDE